MDKNGVCWHCKISHTQSEKNISYSQYLLTSHWQNVRRRAWEGKMKKQCSVCKSKNNLNLHHRTYNHLWKERISVHLVYLCRSCHLKVHFQNGTTPLKWKYLTKKQTLLLRAYKKKMKRKRFLSRSSATT